MAYTAHRFMVPAGSTASGASAQGPGGPSSCPHDEAHQLHPCVGKTCGLSAAGPWVRLRGGVGSSWD
eukprot:7252501-Pyramimonas_sp.AAC.1